MGKWLSSEFKDMRDSMQPLFSTKRKSAQNLSNREITFSCVALIILIILEWSWINKNGAGIQAIATVILVCITFFYAFNTKDLADKTKDVAAATKEMAQATIIMSNEQKEQREIERDKRIIIYTVSKQYSGSMLIEDLPAKTKLNKDRIDFLLPELTGPMDQLKTYQPEKGGMIIRLRTAGEFQTFIRY